jgi:hypothetical protein
VGRQRPGSGSRGAESGCAGDLRERGARRGGGRSPRSGMDGSKGSNTLIASLAVVG